MGKREHVPATPPRAAGRAGARRTSQSRPQPAGSPGATPSSAARPSRASPTGAKALKALEAVEGQAADATPAALDRLIHERIRLGIVSALAVHDSLNFNALKSLLATTDGNLSVHARKLEEAGYIRCTKSFEGRVPRTDFALTATGRSALERYLSHMEAIIRATRER